MALFFIISGKRVPLQALDVVTNASRMGPSGFLWHTHLTQWHFSQLAEQMFSCLFFVASVLVFSLYNCDTNVNVEHGDGFFGRCCLHLFMISMDLYAKLKQIGK